jgi:hypothetical protein
MTRDDVIKLAREAGWTSYDSQDERLERFALEVAAAEREACAKLVEHYRGDGFMARTIRARSQA